MRCCRSFLMSWIVLLTTGCTSPSALDHGIAHTTDIQSLTLSQRSGYIYKYDPISKVETLLGKAVHTDDIILIKGGEPGGPATLQNRYYMLHSNMLLRVLYVSGDTADLSSTPNAKIRQSRRESLDSGYPDWLVLATNTHERGERRFDGAGYGARVAFGILDGNGTDRE